MESLHRCIKKAWGQNISK